MHIRYYHTHGCYVTRVCCCTSVPALIHVLYGNLAHTPKYTPRTYRHTRVCTVTCTRAHAIMYVYVHTCTHAVIYHAIVCVESRYTVCV